jgi:endonuclease III
MTHRANPNEVLSLLHKHFKKYRDFKNVPILERLVLLIVGREVSSAGADACLECLKKDFVDWNEVRLARVDDMKSCMAELGAPDADLRGLKLREMLGKVFTERHMLDAEFIRDEEREKRTAFLAGLPGLDYAQCQALEASLLAEREDVPFSSQIQRVTQRLGWLPKGKDISIAKAKKTLADIADGDTVNLVYGLVRIAEDHCHPRNPDCPRCPLHSVCPTAKSLKDAAGKRESEE